MDGIRTYLLSVVAASIISALALNVVGKKDTQYAVVKLLAGLFLSITVISPWIKIRLNSISDYFESFQTNAADAVSAGTLAADFALDEIIIEKTEAYILDKAISYGAKIEIDVTLSDTQPKAPTYAMIRGSVAPYVRQQLQKVLEDDLGIPKENQSWE